MIPKIVHYCWFGGNVKPDSVIKCIESWKKYCPDYKIIEWNEENFPYNENDYAREAFEARKYAFVTDYARLYVMYNEGGIYMDTDVEILKPIDQFLKHEAFSGFQAEDQVPTGIMASEKGFPLFGEMLADYQNRHFINEDGTFNTISNVTYITDTCKKYGLVPNNEFQEVAGFALYPLDYFCAKNWRDGKIRITKNTYTIHHFAGSWLDSDTRAIVDYRRNCISKYGKILGLIIYKINKRKVLENEQKI